MPSARGIRAGAAFVELSVHDSRLVRGLRSAQRRLRAFSASLHQAGMRMVRMAVLFATPFAIGTKVYADFEQQMANVSTMLQDPAMHMEDFRRAIRRMSVEFGESTETLAAGLYDILSASIPAENALDVLAAAARAAKAGLTDTGTAADAITTVLNSYGLSADRAADVSDLLFSVVKRGKLTFADLAPNIGNVANLAATAGVSLEEMGASIALLTRNGIKTEESITALRAIIQAFLKPSKEGAELARKLGFEMNTATLGAEGLAGVFERISKLPPEAVAELFPNVRALKGVLPALAALDGFAEDIDTMRGRAGATQIAYKKMTNTLSHSFAQLKQSGVAVLAVIGEALAETVGKATEVVKRYLGIIRQWIDQNKGIVLSAVKIIGAIGLVGTALVALGVSGAALAFVFGGIASILSGVGTAIGILGSVLGALLSPIGLAVAGFGVLVAISIKSWTSIQAAWSESVSTLKELWNSFFSAVQLGLTAFTNYILTAWEMVQTTWAATVSFLKKIWAQFNSGVQHGLQTLANHITRSWGAIKTVWTATVSFLKKIWARLTSGLQRGLETLTGSVLLAMDSGAKAVEWLGEKFQALKEVASAAWQGIADALVSGNIGLAAKVLWLTIKMEWQRGIHALNQLWIRFKEFFLSTATDAFWGSVAVLAQAWSAMQSAWVETVSFLQSVWTRFTSGLQSGWNKTQNFLAKGWLELMGLFDEGLDVEEAKRGIDRQAEGQEQRIQSETQRTLEEQGTKRKERLDQIESEREGTLVAISDMADQEDRSRRKQYADDLQRSEEELSKARQEWKAVIGEARTKRLEVETGAPEEGERPKLSAPEIVEKLKEQLSAVGERLNIDVAGTFNAMAVQSLQGSSSEERTAKASEETAKNTRKILEEAREGGLTFS